MHKIAVNKKLKSGILLPILLLGTLAVIGGLGVHRAYATTVISILPSSINDPTLIVGSTFQYQVVITGLSTTLFAFQYDLLFDPTVLQARSVDSFGGFFDALRSFIPTQATCLSSIDNVHGVVTAACTSLGPSTSSTTTSLLVGLITFGVAKLGLSTQSLTNTILLHNAGGGLLENIPVMVGANAVFTNAGFVAKADLPSFDNFLTGTQHRQAWPEKVHFSFSKDTVHTPGLVSLFANGNSTGNIPALTWAVFTVTSDFGIVVVSSPKALLPPGFVTTVPFEATFNPVSPTGILQTGGYHITAQLLFQAMFPDGTLGPVQMGATVKAFHVNVVP